MLLSISPTGLMMRPLLMSISVFWEFSVPCLNSSTEEGVYTGEREI
jgi:hypothetical protein